MGNLRILPRVRLSQDADGLEAAMFGIVGGAMTENNQRTAYVFYFVSTSMAVACLAFVWFISPLGFGFAIWPVANRELLEHVYAGSYYIGIPAILIAQITSLVLFIYKKRRAAYWTPVVSISLFLICIVSILSNPG
jgi:hypothetical protein